mgnify:CR=1 FL=1
MGAVSLTESEIQMQIVDYLSHLAAMRKDFIFFSVPNEGFMKGVSIVAGNERKSKLTAKVVNMLKKMGLTDGIPDLCIVQKNRGAFFLEVKKPDGTVSATQKIIHERMTDLNIPVAVVRSVEDVMRLVGEWGI